MSIERKLPFLPVLLLLFSLSLQANPFLSGKDKDAPSVRPPSSGGFMVETQLRFRELLGKKLEFLKEGGDPVLLFSVLGLTFLYGILHAAGPGHRKTVIFSLILTRKVRWYEPLLVSFISAAIHGGTAVILIVLFQFVFDRIQSVVIQNVSAWMEGISFILLMVLSLFFLVREAMELKKGKKKTEESVSLYGTIAITSAFPCPGVIMIMTFSAVLGVLKTGILSVITLSAGMGLTISLAAYLAYFGREGLFRLLKQKENSIGHLSAFLEMGSYLFLFLFSLWMCSPFIAALY